MRVKEYSGRQGTVESVGHALRVRVPSLARDYLEDQEQWGTLGGKPFCRELGNPPQKDIVWEFKSVLGGKEPWAGQRCTGVRSQSLVGDTWGWSPQRPRALLLQAPPRPPPQGPPHIVCEDDPKLPDLVLDIDGHEPVGWREEGWPDAGGSDPGHLPCLSQACAGSPLAHQVSSPGGGSGLRSLWAVISSVARSMPRSSAIRSLP